MKINCLKVGGRTIKTVVAVFLCLLTGTIRKSDTAFYAAIAAVLCVQRTSKDSFREAFNREMATVLCRSTVFPLLSAFLISRIRLFYRNN